MRITKKHANLQEDQVYGDQRRGRGNWEKAVKRDKLAVRRQKGCKQRDGSSAVGYAGKVRANPSALIAREKDFIYAMMDVN